MNSGHKTAGDPGWRFTWRGQRPTALLLVASLLMLGTVAFWTSGIMRGRKTPLDKCLPPIRLEESGFPTGPYDVRLDRSSLPEALPSKMPVFKVVQHQLSRRYMDQVLESFGADNRALEPSYGSRPTAPDEWHTRFPGGTLRFVPWHGRVDYEKSGLWQAMGLTPSDNSLQTFGHRMGREAVVKIATAFVSSHPPMPPPGEWCWDQSPYEHTVGKVKQEPGNVKPLLRTNAYELHAKRRFANFLGCGHGSNLVIIVLADGTVGKATWTWEKIQEWRTFPIRNAEAAFRALNSGQGARLPPALMKGTASFHSIRYYSDMIPHTYVQPVYVFEVRTRVAKNIFIAPAIEDRFYQSLPAVVEANGEFVLPPEILAERTKSLLAQANNLVQRLKQVKAVSKGREQEVHSEFLQLHSVWEQVVRNSPSDAKGKVGSMLKRHAEGFFLRQQSRRKAGCAPDFLGWQFVRSAEKACDLLRHMSAEYKKVGSELRRKYSAEIEWVQGFIWL